MVRFHFGLHEVTTMYDRPSRTRSGGNFSESAIWNVWLKARSAAGYASNFRLDAYGSWMQWEQYGNRDSA